MKKTSLLFGAAVMMLAASCSNDEVVNVAENHGAAIGFSNFVDNSTRADEYSTSTLPDNMQVWGVTKFGETATISAIFTNQLVERNGVAASAIWTYTPLQYWIPGNSYSFAAIAPYYDNESSDVVKVEQNTSDATAAMDNAGITITFDNSKAEANVDLLYDAKDVAVNDYNTVSFTMGHMLSRVNFKFENTFASDNYSFRVTDVTITNATSKATINKTAETDETKGLWTAVNDVNVFSRTFDFAEVDNVKADKATTTVPVATETHYLIPLTTEKGHNVTFNVQLLMTTPEGNEIEVGKPQEFSVNIDPMNFKSGWSYTFVAQINQNNINTDPENPVVSEDPIEFTVTSVDNFKDTDEKVIEPKQEVTE